LPGENVVLEFDLSYITKGFKNRGSNTSIVENGTFLHSNSYLPAIGYNEGGELSSDDTRKKHGLKPKERMALVNDSNARLNNYISHDADWIDFETTISTSPDQIAIAPGYLQREWTEGNRRYFHYKMDCKILNFYSFLSARYEVKRDSYRSPPLTPPKGGRTGQHFTLPQGKSDGKVPPSSVPPLGGLEGASPIDIMFAGHTHGMQMGVEIGNFKWSPVQYIYKQWAGLYQKNNQYLYVNRGFGFIGFPGRVGILPEITIFELSGTDF